MKIYFSSLFIFLINLVFGQELNKTYSSLVEYKNSDIFQKYDLKFIDKENFEFSRYADEVCYRDYDTIQGKWLRSGNEIHFFDIDQKNHITKSTENLKPFKIDIQETCVRSYEHKDDKDLYLIVLDNNFELIEILKSIEYDYNEKELLLQLSFVIPENAFQIIYVRGNLNKKVKEKLLYFNNGINLVDFETYNYFKISNCSKKVNNIPTQIINPYFTLELKEDGSLISKKDFVEVDNKPRKRVFKLENKK